MLIEKSADELLIQIKPRFQFLRFLMFPFLIMAAFTGMVVFAFGIIANVTETCEQSFRMLLLFSIFLLIGAVPIFIAIAMIVTAFTEERLSIKDGRFNYRCSILGFGTTRSYALSDISILIRTGSTFRNYPLCRFFGLAKPRFRMTTTGKLRSLGGDLNDADAKKIELVLRLKNLIA